MPISFRVLFLDSKFFKKQSSVNYSVILWFESRFYEHFLSIRNHGLGKKDRDNVIRMLFWGYVHSQTRCSKLTCPPRTNTHFGKQFLLDLKAKDQKLLSSYILTPEIDSLTPESACQKHTQDITEKANRSFQSKSGWKVLKATQCNGTTFSLLSLSYCFHQPIRQAVSEGCVH